MLQSLVAGAVFLLTTCCGIHVGYSAILLPQLKADNSSIPTDVELGSWIGETLAHHIPSHRYIFRVRRGYGTWAFHRSVA
jgi:hypothetical protein